ncbi:NAD(P)-dependent oxidoreductase [Chitinophaga sancti]|uniref:NAD-dependent epimerase/dehydratase family protein n=1 Tax=Chitinophaga sancti TaxID=1004 RepID=UPI002A765BC3|nr:NAD(P)-dependent oxidoreductase [Chitinophaga sancti]WPQ64522.1 NAD(P)-dependent oxidoreductase [Chitinophaga sancti]
MKKVLVTGATGFIGNYVVNKLLQSNCTVITSSSGLEKVQQTSWYPAVHHIVFNIELFDDSINYFDFFGAPDAVIHLTWEGLPNYKSDFHYKVNLPRHYAFLQNMIRHGLRDLTVTGTCFEYGMKEGLLREDMETDPQNPYAIAKDTLRKHLQVLQLEIPFDLKWLRLFYMYGKGQHPKSLLSQLDTAITNGDTVFNMSGGEQVRDYLPVDKVATYIVSTALQNQVTGVINCCSGKPITVKQLVLDYLEKKQAAISLNLGYYQYADYEPMVFWGDTNKLSTIGLL